ncbi:UNVERIFIED_CONTAM: hypothetical protein Sangu_0987800 [Sesamum angustifolium]|uniref:Uncharacterized protein n=1 Tax=Sesamum angustifolium TaxID=2727405 RepID=A0AAW2PD88_9LAMI
MPLEPTSIPQTLPVHPDKEGTSAAGANMLQAAVRPWNLTPPGRDFHSSINVTVQDQFPHPWGCMLPLEHQQFCSIISSLLTGGITMTRPCSKYSEYSSGEDLLKMLEDQLAQTTTDGQHPPTSFKASVGIIEQQLWVLAATTGPVHVASR